MIRQMIQDIPDLSSAQVSMHGDVNQVLYYVVDEHRLIVPRKLYHATLGMISDQIKSEGVTQ